MKYLLERNLFKKHYRGDSLLSRILEIVKDEGLEMIHSGGYRVEIDDRIYSFSQLGTGLIDDIFHNKSFISIYLENQKVNSAAYGTYAFIWKCCKRWQCIDCEYSLLQWHANCFKGANQLYN